MVELTAEEAVSLLRIEEDKLRSLEVQRQQLTLALQEMTLAKATLDIIPDKQGNALVPIGAGAFIPIKAGENKIIIEIGAGVVAEKTVEEGLELINKREETLNNYIQEVDIELDKTAKQVKKLSEKLQAYFQKQQRQDSVPVIG